MFNFPNNNNSYGRNQGYGYSPYGGQMMEAPYQGTQSTSSLISKVMGLLAFSFLFAFLGTAVGGFILGSFTGFTYLIVAIAGFVVLFALQMAINKPGLNLFLLYLFAFLEGLSLYPLINYYLHYAPNILGGAFLITMLTTAGLAIYSWTAKRDFSRLGDYLFFGLIFLVVVGLIGIFIPGLFGGLIGLLISVVGVAIFSGYVIFYVQRAKYMPDTMPNAIMLTVSLFLTIINLFLYILRILSFLQGNNRSR